MLQIGRRAGMRITLPQSTVSFLLTVVFVLGVGVVPASSSAVLSCESAEECFRTAMPAGSDPSAGRPQEEYQLLEKIKRLRAVVERYPESLWAKRARLLAGVLLREQGPTQAAELLKVAQREHPLLGDYVRFWRAEALVHAGEMSQAARVFESIRKVVPETLLETAATFRGGDAWYRAGQCPKTIAVLSRAVSRRPQDPAAPAALMNIADCQIREIKAAEGLATLKQVWVRYPHTEEAKEALARLSARAEHGTWEPAPRDLYERAESLLSLAMYREALDELDEFLMIAPEHPQRDRARFKLGLAYARLKRYDEARRVYQQLVDEGGAVSGKAAVWLARIFVRQGDGEPFLALPRLFSELPLSGEEKASILLFLGVWLEDEREYDEAISIYHRAARTGVGSTVRPKALWRIGWVQYRRGLFSESVATFGQALDAEEVKNESGWTSRFLYWTARALEQQQDPRATEVYAQLCGRYPLTYYGQLVRSCEQIFDSEQRAMNPDMERSTTGHGGPPPRLKGDLHYRKGIELKVLGLNEDAVRELRWVARTGTRTWQALLELSLRLSEAGGHHEALRLALVYFRDHLEGGRKLTSSTLWRVAYPTGYLPIIRSYAANPVDPYLVAAIIREESLYEVRALSPAGAVGLMQIMPATARAMTGESGDLSTIRARLLEYRTNIRIGSEYLGTLLSKFSGNVMHAVAAYNAGPFVVSSWIRRHGEATPTEFVELIPYRETRGYVKRVLRTYREYHRLQNGGCGASSLDKAC